jgi:hypothetical protein
MSEGYRQATSDEKLKLFESAAQLADAAHKLQLADINKKLAEAQVELCANDAEKARVAIHHAKMTRFKVFGELNLDPADEKAIKDVDGVTYLREKAKVVKDVLDALAESNVTELPKGE